MVLGGAGVGSRRLNVYCPHTGARTNAIVSRLSLTMMCKERGGKERHGERGLREVH